MPITCIIEHGIKVFLYFITIFVFFEILVPNIFENISKSVRFLRKAINTCFVENLPSFQENLKLLKSVACSQSYDSISQSHFFFDQSLIEHSIKVFSLKGEVFITEGEGSKYLSMVCLKLLLLLVPLWQSNLLRMFYISSKNSMLLNWFIIYINLCYFPLLALKLLIMILKTIVEIDSYCFLTPKLTLTWDLLKSTTYSTTTYTYGAKSTPML